MRVTNEYEILFGKHDIEYEGVLVIGRDHYLDVKERDRLNWRRAHLILDSKKIHCVTFDELLQRILDRLDVLEVGPEAKPPGSSERS